MSRWLTRQSLIRYPPKEVNCRFVLQCGAHVTGFEHKGGSFEIRFKNRRPARAKALILAMPRRALDLLAPSSPLLQQDAVVSLIKSVTPRPLFKLLTTYMNPWWLPAGVEKGRTTTDLPVRQTYYWPKSDGEPALQGRAMLMASYDDGLNIGFWDGFRPKRGVGWRPGARASSDMEWFQGTDDQAAYPHWFKYRAPKRMVREVQRQLAVIHGLGFIPDVINASFKDWGDDPFGGGWNSWNIGVKSQNVKQKILKPTDAPLYICGEAYSDAQGWVEGALQTADMMLEKYFGLSPLAEDGSNG